MWTLSFELVQRPGSVTLRAEPVRCTLTFSPEIEMETPQRGTFISVIVRGTVYGRPSPI